MTVPPRKRSHNAPLWPAGIVTNMFATRYGVRRKRISSVDENAMKWPSIHLRMPLVGSVIARSPFDNPALVHDHATGCPVEISLVVGDHDHCLAALQHGWQDFIVELAAELRILVRGELVEHVDRSIFEHR